MTVQESGSDSDLMDMMESIERKSNKILGKRIMQFGQALDEKRQKVDENDKSAVKLTFCQQIVKSMLEVLKPKDIE